MSISIKLYGTLGRYIKGYEASKGISLRLDRETTVAGLVHRLGIPPAKVGIVTINGEMADAETRVPDHCLVKIFQPIFGG